MTNPAHNDASSRDRMDRAIAVVRRLFAGRTDTYATYVPGEKYSGDRIKAPITDEVIARHLSGQRPIGVYPLIDTDDGSVTSWACIDIDMDNTPNRAHEIATEMAHAAAIKLATPIPVHVEITKSKQAHVWLFFDEPVPAWQARGLAHLVITTAGHKPFKRKGGGEEIVICPAHDKTPPKDEKGGGGVGMAIYLPWYGANAKDGRQVFYDWHTGAVFTDQVAAMEAADVIPVSVLSSLIDAHDIKPQNVRQMTAKPDDERFVPKAPAGSIVALTDGEFTNLCAKLKALRAMRENPGGCAYVDWFAGMMHLVPFADGRDRAHELSRLDAGRYDAAITERQWSHAVQLYSREDGQPEARVSQRIVSFWREGGRPDVTPISGTWCIWNGCFAKRKAATQGPEQDPTPITNFTATVVCEEYIDDGTGFRERHVRIRGQLMNGVALPEISIPTKDWTTIKVWMHKGWGFRPVMYGEDRHVLQCIALMGMEAPERMSYTHTGWTKLDDGRLAFLTPTGPRGIDMTPDAFAESARVSTPNELRNYDIPESCTPDQAMEAYVWLERLLLSGDLKATAPLLSAMFLAPLSSFINVDFALFVTGHTGTHKSSLVAATMAVWGARWSKDQLPTSFNSTANAIENLGFQAKDLPLPIDNYVPDQKSEAQRTLKRISHSIGDHAGRSRLNANAQAVAAKPFRSLCIITGEDVPYGAGAGATNRYYIIPMARDTLKLRQLEEVQEAGWAGKLAPAMTHYLRWLATRMVDPAWVQKVAAYQYQLEKEARRMAAGKDHDRLTSQTSWILTGLELARQSHPSKNWVNAGLQIDAQRAAQSALMSRRQMSSESSLPYRFLSAFQYLVQCGAIHGVRAESGDAPVNAELAAFCGWDTVGIGRLVNPNSRTAFWIHGDGDEFTICMRPDEIVTQIKQSIRMECAIPEGSRGIGQALISEGLLNVDGSDNSHVTSRIMLHDKTRPRVWKIRGRAALALLGLNEDEVSPPVADSLIVRVDGR